MRSNGVAKITANVTVMPIHDVLDDNIIDITFGFNHLEDFIAEQLFKMIFEAAVVHRKTIKDGYSLPSSTP